MSRREDCKVPQIRFKGFHSEWIEKSLGELCEPLEYGLNAASVKFDGKNKYLRITDIDDASRTFIYKDLTSPKIDLALSQSYLLKKGDIVFARTGASVGKTYIYKEEDDHVFFAGFLIRARVKAVEDASFIFQNTLTKRYRDFVKLTSQRSGQPGINAREYSSFSFLCPSEQEEKNEIGKCFKELDQLIQQHQHKHEKLMALKKSMHQKMFPQPGATTPEIRFKGFSEEWVEKKLGELMPITSAARVHKHEWTRSGVPFFRTSDVVSLYKGEKNEMTFISLDLYEKLSEKIGRIKCGDILITGGGSIGIPFLAKSDDPLYFKDADLLWLKVPESIDSIYLYTFFSSAPFRRYVGSISHIGTIGHYTVEQAKKTPITIPLQAEQKKIGAYFRQLDELIFRHATQLEKLKQVKAACLEKMFVSVTKLP